MGLAQTVLSMKLMQGRKHETRVLGRPPEELELKLNLAAGRASREGTREGTVAETVLGGQTLLSPERPGGVGGVV